MRFLKAEHLLAKAFGVCTEGIERSCRDAGAVVDGIDSVG